MYSLPISTYSDYWRATKIWSSYIGGIAVFAAGTHYSAMSAPHITEPISTFQQATQTLTIKKLGAEVSFSSLIQKPSSQGTAIRGVSSQGAERISNKIEIVDSEIPFKTQYVESDEILPGKRKTQEKGENGILREVVKTFEVDGRINHQQVQKSFELKTPKNEVIIQNTKTVSKKKVVIPNTSQPAASQSIEVAKMNVSRSLNSESTAYTFTGNKTATGIVPRQGIIAVDPKVIALGSKVYVEGYGYAIAADTGGDIRGNRIDVFFPTLRQCINWGRRVVRIYVIKPN